MNQKKLKITLRVVNNMSVKYPETAQDIKGNMNEMCEKEKRSVEKVSDTLVFLFQIMVAYF